MIEFHVGDKVRLKEGGPPKMTVIYPYTPGWKPRYIFGIIPIGDMPPMGSSGVVCQFWDASGDRQTKQYHPSMLEIAPS